MVGQPGAATRPPTPLQRRRWLAVAVVAVVVVVAASVVSVWLPSRFHGSRDGCLDLTLPGVVGAVMVERCGAPARQFCATYRSQPGADAETIDRSCRAAGL